MKNEVPEKKDCATCCHEPEWAKCISTDTWLHGLCGKTGNVLNKRRKYAYCWDARIENCPAWESRATAGRQHGKRENHNDSFSD